MMSEVTTPPLEQPQIDQAKLNALVERMYMEQSVTKAIFAGLMTAIAGALIWAVVTAATHFQIGWMAVGVGFLVGYSVRTLGKGMTKTYGFIGAAMSLFGCLLGNLLSVCIMVCNQLEIPLQTFLNTLDIGMIVDIMIRSFQPMHLLFYGIAVYEGYRFSFRTITEAEMQDVMAKPGSHIQ